MQAAALAQDAVRQAWEDLAEADSPLLAHLIHDAARPYGAVDGLHQAIRHAHASVPVRHREPGRPATDPVGESAASRARAVQEAVEEFGRRAVFRNRLSVQVAAAAARTEAVLDLGRGMQAEGRVVYKRWRARTDSSLTCHWCRHLDGVTILLDEDFAPFIGSAADLGGHGRLTRPPEPYRGQLPGPPLHPHCGERCRIELVAAWPGDSSPGPQPGSLSAVPPVPPAVPRPDGVFLPAAAVRALPEARYQALIAFLRAAVLELGQVMKRLAGIE